MLKWWPIISPLSLSLKFFLDSLTRKCLILFLQLQRHLQAHTFPSIERLRQKEQSLQRRMLRVRENSSHWKILPCYVSQIAVKVTFTLVFWFVCLQVMRIIEGLEGKGFRLPLTKGEAELSEKLTAITRQVCFIFYLFNSSSRITKFDVKKWVWILRWKVPEQSFLGGCKVCKQYLVLKDIPLLLVVPFISLGQLK